jgi:predicted nucleic acid-binding protein
LDRPRSYDTAYLALARLLQCELWTADQKFYNAVKDKAIEVKWIGEDAAV